jgi:hypothetical protein
MITFIVLAAAAAASGVDQNGNHHLDDGNAELDNEHEKAQENDLSSGRQRRPHPRDLIGKAGHQRFEKNVSLHAHTKTLYKKCAHSCASAGNCAIEKFADGEVPAMIHVQAQSFMFASPMQIDDCSISSLLVLTWLRAVTAAPVAAGMKDERNPSSRHRMAGSIVSQLRNDRLPDSIRMACAFGRGDVKGGGLGGFNFANDWSWYTEGLKGGGGLWGFNFANDWSG